MGNRDPSSRAQCEADHLPPSGAKFKNSWSNIYTDAKFEIFTAANVKGEDGSSKVP
jgi:hypothetical protein